MTEATKIYELTLLFWAALISPGPNLIMVLRTSADHTRREGFMVTLGLTAGVFLQGLVGILGLQWIFQTYPSTLNIIQVLGALYLSYLGVRGLMAKKSLGSATLSHSSSKRKLSPFQMGFLTQILNPFATVSICSLLSMFYSNYLWVQGTYIAIFIVSYLVWYGSLTLILTTGTLQAKLFGVRHWIERITGIILIYFAVKIIMASF